MHTQVHTPKRKSCAWVKTRDKIRKECRCPVNCVNIRICAIPFMSLFGFCKEVAVKIYIFEKSFWLEQCRIGARKNSRDQLKCIIAIHGKGNKGLN